MKRPPLFSAVRGPISPLPSERVAVAAGRWSVCRQARPDTRTDQTRSERIIQDQTRPDTRSDQTRPDTRSARTSSQVCTKSPEPHIQDLHQIFSCFRLAAALTDENTYRRSPAYNPCGYICLLYKFEKRGHRGTFIFKGFRERKWLWFSFFLLPAQRN